MEASIAVLLQSFINIFAALSLFPFSNEKLYCKILFNCTQIYSANFHSFQFSLFINKFLNGL